MGCYIWCSEEGTGRGRSPHRPLLAVPNATAHPSTPTVPIAVLLYNGPLLCGFNVPFKGLMASSCTQDCTQRQDYIKLELVDECIYICYCYLLYPSVCHCKYSSVPFSSYLTLKNIMVLKFRLGVTQGYWKWHHSIDCVPVPINFPL